MKKQTKVLLAGIGAAVVGGAVGYYANSDKGRQQLTQAANTIKETSSKAASRAGEYANTAKTAISDMTSKAATYVNQATRKAENAKADGQKTMVHTATGARSQVSNGETMS